MPAAHVSQADQNEAHLLSSQALVIRLQHRSQYRQQFQHYRTITTHILQGNEGILQFFGSKRASAFLKLRNENCHQSLHFWTLITHIVQTVQSEREEFEMDMIARLHFQVICQSCDRISHFYSIGIHIAEAIERIHDIYWIHLFIDSSNFGS